MMDKRNYAEPGDDPNLERRERDESRFKIDTTINIAHILTTVGLIVMLFSWGTDVKTTVATNTSDISHLKFERAREIAEVKAGVHELNLKLDRLIERGMTPVNYGLVNRKQ